MLNITSKVSTFSSLNPSYRDRRQPQAGLKSKHKGAGTGVFKDLFFKDLTLSMCEMLHIHRYPFLLFHGLSKSHLPWCAQLFQTQTRAPVLGQESLGRSRCARQEERRARGRGGHEEEEGTRKKRALLDLIQIPLESVGAFPHWAKTKNLLKLMGIFLLGFMGSFGPGQVVSLNLNQAWYWCLSLLSVSLPKAPQPPLVCHPLTLQTGVGSICIYIYIYYFNLYIKPSGSEFAVRRRIYGLLHSPS